MSRPKGGSGLSITSPCTPPVKSSSALIFRICGTATASAKVVSARYNPPRRNAGNPIRKPTAAQTMADTGSVAQHGRHIGADRIERTVAQRYLAIEAGQDRQPQDGNGVHHDHRELEQVVVAQ